MPSPAETFLSAEVRYQPVGAADFAYRKFGAGGPPILLVHGWPLWGFTWRNLVPHLAAHRECWVVDLAGAGSTRWREGNDFTLGGQAENLKRFAEAVGLRSYDVVSHDTGATIARQLALIAPGTIGKLVLIGTEIPHHRPPLVPLMQKLMLLPGANRVLRRLLTWKPYVRSRLGFGECFADPSLLDGEFEAQFIRPLIDDERRLEGQMRYARGIDWDLVDSLAEGHRRIKGPVLLVWGEKDSFFPVERAREMVPQFADCRGLRVIPGAKLLVHEEKAEAVAGAVLDFLRS